MEGKWSANVIAGGERQKMGGAEQQNVKEILAFLHEVHSRYAL